MIEAESTTAAFAALVAELRPELDRIIAQYEEPRSALLPIIHVFQARQGYVSHEAMRTTAQLVGVTTAVVESTVSFYTLFYRRPVGKYILQVCRGLSCTINGAEDVMARARTALGVGHLETTPDGLISYEEVECLAACDRATCAQVNLEFVYDLTPAGVDALVGAIRAGTHPVAPLAQTVAPEATWIVRQDDQVARGTKTPGASEVRDANNAGGVGDASGIIMLDRMINSDVALRERTRERVAAQAQAIVAVVEETNHHAGH